MFLLAGEGNSLTTQSYQIAIGYNAAAAPQGKRIYRFSSRSISAGYEHVYIGDEAGLGVSGSTSSCNRNVGVGPASLRGITTGDENVGLGKNTDYN